MTLGKKCSVTFSFFWVTLQNSSQFFKSNALKWGEYSHAAYQTGPRDDINTEHFPRIFIFLSIWCPNIYEGVNGVDCLAYKDAFWLS